MTGVTSQYLFTSVLCLVYIQCVMSIARNSSLIRCLGFLSCFCRSYALEAFKCFYKKDSYFGEGRIIWAVNALWSSKVKKTFLCTVPGKIRPTPGRWVDDLLDDSGILVSLHTLFSIVTDRIWARCPSSFSFVRRCVYFPSFFWGFRGSSAWRITGREVLASLNFTNLGQLTSFAISFSRRFPFVEKPTLIDKCLLRAELVHGPYLRKR